MFPVVVDEVCTHCSRDFGPLLHTDLLQILKVPGLSMTFSSLQRFSIGFRSGDWLGHSRTLRCFLRSLSLVALAVCFRSWSCWKTQPRPIFNALTERRRLLAKISRYMAPSMIIDAHEVRSCIEPRPREIDHLELLFSNDCTNCCCLILTKLLAYCSVANPSLVLVYNSIPDALTRLSSLGHCGEVGVFWLSVWTGVFYTGNLFKQVQLIHVMSGGQEGFLKRN